MLERKTRYFKIIRLPNKTSDSILKAFSDLQKEYGDLFSKVFRTITTDNGSEFSSLSNLEKVAKTLVYFATLTPRMRKSQTNAIMVWFADSFQKENE